MQIASLYASIHFFTFNVYLSLIENVIIPPIYSKKSGLENTGDHIFHGFFSPLLKLHISSQMELNYAAQTVYNVHRVRGCTDLSFICDGRAIRTLQLGRKIILETHLAQ